MLYEFEFSHKINFSMTSIPVRGKGNLSKTARVTDLHPTTYSTIEKWSQDPILRSKGFDFIASKFPTVFGLKKSDLRTKCKSRAYHLVSKHKTETKEDIGATTTLQINKSIEKLGLGDPEDPEMAMIPAKTVIMNGSNEIVVDIDELYHPILGGLKVVVKKREVANVVVKLAEFSVPVVDCNDMKNVRVELLEDTNFLFTRIRIKDPKVPTCKWVNSLGRNLDVEATTELRERTGDYSKNVYYCEDTYHKEAAFECNLQQQEDQRFKYTTFSVRSSELGPNIVLTNKYFNDKATRQNSETKLDCKMHVHAGYYKDTKEQRTGEVRFIAVIESTVTQLTAAPSFTEEDDETTEYFNSDCKTNPGKKPDARVNPTSEHSDMELDDATRTKSSSTKTPSSQSTYSDMELDERQDREAREAREAYEEIVRKDREAREAREASEEIERQAIKHRTLELDRQLQEIENKHKAIQRSIDEAAKQHKEAANVTGFTHNKKSGIDWKKRNELKQFPRVPKDDSEDTSSRNNDASGANNELADQPVIHNTAPEKTSTPICNCASGMFCTEPDVPLADDSNVCVICMKRVHTNCTAILARPSTICWMCETAPTITSDTATATATATGNTTSTSNVPFADSHFSNAAAGSQNQISRPTEFDEAMSEAIVRSLDDLSNIGLPEMVMSSTVEQQQSNPNPDPNQDVSGLQTNFDRLIITQEQRTRSNLVLSQAQRAQANFEKGQSCPAPGEQAGKRSRIVNVSGSVGNKGAPQRESEHQSTHQDTPSLPDSSASSDVVPPPTTSFSHKSNDVCRSAKRSLRVDARIDFDGLLLADILATPSVNNYGSVGNEEAPQREPEHQATHQDTPSLPVSSASSDVLNPSIPHSPFISNGPVSTDSTDSMFSFDQPELERQCTVEPPPPPPPPPPLPPRKKSPPPRKVSPRNHHAKHKRETLKDQANDFVKVWNQGGGVTSTDLSMSSAASKPAARRPASKKVSTTPSTFIRRRTRSSSQHARRGRSTTPRSKDEKVSVEQEIKNIEARAKAELLKEQKEMEEL